MTKTPDPIAHAARLLREAAQELKQAHTIGGIAEWDGTEPEVQAVYDQHMAAAAAIEEWERAVGAGSVEPLRKREQARGQAGFEAWWRDKYPSFACHAPGIWEMSMHHAAQHVRECQQQRAAKLILQKVETLIASVNDAHLAKREDWKQACFDAADSAYADIKGQLAALQAAPPAQAGEAIAEIVSASHDDAQFGERGVNFLRDFQHLEYGTKLYAQAAPPAPTSATESVLIDGVAYDVPAAVAGELLSLHLDILASAAPPAPAAVAVPADALEGVRVLLRVAKNQSKKAGMVLAIAVVQAEVEKVSARITAAPAQAVAVPDGWWRKRADEIELQVARSGSKEAMRCYTDMRTLLQAAAAPAQAVAVPIELQGVKEAVDQGSGFWRSCTGCHELNEGHATGPVSKVFGCALGNGCSECGGIGAVWDDTDYGAMADAMAATMSAAPAQEHATQLAGQGQGQGQGQDETMQALSDLTNALRERHHGRMPEEVQRAYDKAWTIVFAGPQSAAPAAPAVDARDGEAIDTLARALEMFVGSNPLHSLCVHEGMDAMGRVKGTWSAAAEANARASLKLCTPAIDAARAAQGGA